MNSNRLKMLWNDLYKIVDEPDGGRRATVRLNPAHEIFMAHFPGKPIMPGVCQIQVVGELLGRILGCVVRLTDIKNVKYMAVIAPDEVQEFTIDFQKLEREGDCCRVMAVLAGCGRVFSKMSLTYHVVCDCPDIQ